MSKHRGAPSVRSRRSSTAAGRPPPAPGRRRGSLRLALLAALVLAPACNPPDRTTTFPSPAGVAVRIECRCFGLPCGHRAFAEARLPWGNLSLPLLSLDAALSDPEACVFGTARVRWSEDGATMRWEVDTRHGPRRGTISLW